MTYNATSGHIESWELSKALSKIISILDDVRGLWTLQEITGTDIGDSGVNNNDFTASASVATWFSHANRCTALNFNGTTQYLYRANDTDFDFGDGAGNDTAFSVIACIKPSAVASRTVIAKYDLTAASEAREWKVFFDANGYPTIELYDESADAYIGRQQTALYTTGTWSTLMTTYDASETSAGCKIYVNGVQVDNGNHQGAVYNSMDVVNTNLYGGCTEDAAGAQAEFFQGDMCFLGVAAKELSARECHNLNILLRGLIGV